MAKPTKAKKANRNTLPKDSKPETKMFGMVARRWLVSAAFFLSAWILQGWGMEQLKTGSEMSPWIIAFGVLLLAWAIILSQDVWTHILAKRNVILRWFIIVGVSVAAILVPGIHFQDAKNNAQEQLLYISSYNGQIIAGNSPTPVPLNKDLPSDTITVMLGDTRVLMDKSQYYILAYQGKRVIGFRFDTSGNMLINADINGKNDYIITIKDNAWQVNPKLKLVSIPTNEHSVLLQDFSGNIIFYLDYINPQAIRILGNFYIGLKSSPLVVHPNGKMTYNNLTITENNATIIVANHGGSGFWNFDY
jgi:hypothetical protein